MRVSLDTKTEAVVPGLISVVIPTWNSSETIERCLVSLARQTYRNSEIIIVDKLSNDGTASIGRRYAKVLECDLERSEARNFAAEHSCGEFLFFMDSDMSADPCLLQECIDLARRGCDAIIIPEQSVGNSFLARVRAFERSRNYGNTLYEAARFLTRKAFVIAGGYNPSLTAFEDFDLQARLEEKSLSIGRVSKYLCHWEDSLTLGRHLRKKKAYARDAKSYLRLHPEFGLKQLLPTKLLGAARRLGSFRNLSLLAFLGILKVLEAAVSFPEFLRPIGRSGVRF